MPKSLRTRRLILRPFRLGDIPDFLAHLRPEVSLPLGYGAPAASLAQARRFLLRALSRRDGANRYSILLRSGEWIGACVLRWPYDGVGELGYSIRLERQGRGYAGEAVGRLVDAAFRSFGAHRVQATCWVRNAPSIKVLRRAGLRKEGLLRGFHRRDGVTRDEYIYGITRADWERL